MSVALCYDWKCVLRGVRRAREPCSFNGKKYRFDERGALIRVNSTDYAGNTQDEKAKRVRTRDADTPVTDEHALGVMAALLGEFRQFAFR